MDQRISEYESWDDLREYCRHSADPVGRLVLGVIGRADDAQLVAWSDDVCTGLQLVNFLQDVPRDLALGRVYLPAEDRRRFGVTVARPAERAADAAARVRGGSSGRPARRRASGCARRSAGAPARRSGSSRAVAWPRSTRFATRSWDVFNGRPRPSRAAAGSRRCLLPHPMTTVEEAYAEVERLTRARARNFAYGIMLLPKPKRRAIAAIYAFAREVDDVADDPGLDDGAKRERLEAAAGRARCAPRTECDVRRARRRAPPVSDPG